MHNFRMAINGPLIFTPPQKLLTFDDFPETTKSLLKANEAYSIRFIREAQWRQRWLNEHTFTPVIFTCADGRMLDTETAFGEEHDGMGHVPTGIINVERSSGAISGLESLATCYITRDRVHQGRPIIHLQLAHWSSSHPTSASCAALEHNTEAALNIVEYNAKEMANAFPGRIVAFHGLTDTDWDSVTIYGPRGKIDTFELANDRGIFGDGLRTQLKTMIQTIFPRTCEPLSSVNGSWHADFYEELAMYLSYNVEYVRFVIDSGRQVELLTHEERLLAIGRAIAPLKGYNSCFYCNDHSRRKKADFNIGWRFVTLNTIVDAITADNRDWRTPAIINTPLDPDDDPLTQLHVRHLQERYDDIARQNAKEVFDLIRQDPRIAAQIGRIPWITRLEPEELVERTSWCLSTSAPETRLLEPFV